MKKFLFMAILLIGGTIVSVGEPRDIPLSIINESEESEGIPKAPPRPLVISHAKKLLFMDF